MNKSMKPSGPKPLTPEEKQQQILRFLSQKREQYATSILFGLVHNPNLGMTAEQAVEWSMKAADLMMEKLFPIAEQAPENEKQTAENEE